MDYPLKMWTPKDGNLTRDEWIWRSGTPFFSDKAREFELVNGAECDGLRSRIGFILKQT